MKLKHDGYRGAELIAKHCARIPRNHARTWAMRHRRGPLLQTYANDGRGPQDNSGDALPRSEERSSFEFQLPHEIAFSKRRPAVAENVVSRGCMKKEVR